MFRRGRRCCFTHIHHGDVIQLVHARGLDVRGGGGCCRVCGGAPERGQCRAKDLAPLVTRMIPFVGVAHEDPEFDANASTTR
jgi:hypothetical protein